MFDTAKLQKNVRIEQIYLDKSVVKQHFYLDKSVSLGMKLKKSPYPDFGRGMDEQTNF